MHTIPTVQEAFTTFLQNKYTLSKQQISNCILLLNTDPARAEFGDLSTSAPLFLAKQLKQNPTDMAQDICASFAHESIQKLAIGGAGFINMYLTPAAYKEIATELFEQRSSYFKPVPLGTKQKISVEFVSANPTGPLHFGHGRGGIIIRCQQALGIEAQLPEDAYHGEYLNEIAQKCIAEYGVNVLEKSESFFKEYAQEHLLKEIKQTLLNYGITFDTFFSEKTLHENGSIEQIIDLLTRKQLIYQHEGALWFAATKFGDDKDRVVRKATGEWTYVAADIAYLKNKADRGFTHIVMVLGHDHHSYATRLQAVRSALEIIAPLEIILYQLVKIKDSGTQVRMSKRKGTIVALEDIIQTVGKDVARFFYLHRKADAQLDFDIDLALKKTEENPVYYIQYAYVRIKSILSHASELIPHALNITKDDTEFLTPQEHQLIKKVASLKQLLETIAHNHQIHLISYYLMELAHSFHTYYGHVKIVEPNEIAKTKARLLVLLILKHTFGIGLDLIGISKPEKM
jgi:arginyl-tRNA synthetase